MPRFILRAIHPEYGCPAFETMFEADRPDELRVLLGPEAKDDPEFEKYYYLEPADLAAISQRFDVSFEPGDCDVELFKYTERDDQIPYLPHTNYELPLMLDGRKKLARFSDVYPPHQHFWEDAFDRFVAEGLLHKEVDIEPFDKPHRHPDGRVREGLRTAWYTPKGEEWRINAFRMILKAKGGWNDTLERLEGMLYGYEDWQNDWWEEYRRRKLRQYGTSLVYAALTPSELTSLEASGFRALPPLDRSLTVISSLQDDLEKEERQQLRQAVEQPTLVRFRVKTRSLLTLSGTPQARVHLLRADQIKDVNALLLDRIEVIAQ